MVEEKTQPQPTGQPREEVAAMVEEKTQPQPTAGTTAAKKRTDICVHIIIQYICSVLYM